MIDRLALVFMALGLLATLPKSAASQIIRLPEVTVANLPAAAGFARSTFMVTDGSTATDCTVGGGATVVECFSNGTAWIAMSGFLLSVGSVTSGHILDGTIVGNDLDLEDVATSLKTDLEQTLDHDLLQNFLDAEHINLIQILAHEELPFERSGAIVGSDTLKFTNGGLTIGSAATIGGDLVMADPNPLMLFEETDGTTNEKVVRMGVFTGAFRIDGRNDTDTGAGAGGANMIAIDLTNGNVGISNDTPAEALDVTGSGTFTGTVTAGGGTLTTGTTAQDGTLVFHDDDAGGDATVTIQPPDALGTSYTLTLPPNDGTTGQVLHTDGNGVTSWDTDDGAGSGDNITVNGLALVDANFTDSTVVAFQQNRTASPDEVSAYIVAGSIGTGHIGTDGVSADELNAAGVEAELEAVLDLNELQGAVTDGQVPDNITITGLSGTNTGDEPAADLTTPGIVELATGAETNTGTDATRAVTPDGLDDWTGSAQVTTLGTIGTGTWQGTTVAVDQGGTGAVSLTDGGILLGSGTGAVTALGAATNGQIPIGDGTTDPVLATITGTANEITVTNGAGTITIDIPASPTLDGTNFTGIPSSAITTEVRSMWWGAGALSSDGTNCADPGEVTIGSWGKKFATICTDNDGSIVTGTTVMPDGWDAGTVTFELVYVQDAVDTGALNADVSGRCTGAAETPAAYGTEIAIDDAAVTGTDAMDATTSAAVTLAGTCTAGDMVQFQVAIDATGTTTAMATLNIIGVKMEYTSNIGD